MYKYLTPPTIMGILATIDDEATLRGMVASAGLFFYPQRMDTQHGKDTLRKDLGSTRGA